ncbi:uncharacterized protein UTRI_03815 [Ustilago trichophora]|uniref:Uncharacterized protein n=1 Tax=Ustilago trichophora TaxID=86804 RepID=A0A5C3E4P3_9BASI|nr:uncharacterized protein UTRI_03815 [Ustilago trichophora]
MVHIFNTLSVAVLVAAMSVSALPYHDSGSSVPSGDSSDQGPGNYDPSKLIYFSNPNKDTMWAQGDRVFFNWRNALEGSAQIWVTSKDDDDSEPVLVIKDVDTRNGNDDCTCDRGSRNEVCGRVIWIVPEDLPDGKYQALLVLNNESSLGPTYSDYFTIKHNNIDGDDGDDDDDDDDDGDRLYGTEKGSGTTAHHGDSTA